MTTRLSPNDAVCVTFKTQNIDGSPFQNVQIAKVVSHYCGGWLTLRFKNGTHYQYRVHLFDKKECRFQNCPKAKVFLNIKKLKE